MKKKKEWKMPKAVRERIRAFLDQHRERLSNIKSTHHIPTINNDQHSNQ
jgi:hypothetical protein